MSAILYPVAADAEAALKAPLARMARAREAQAAVGQAVVFVSEAVGPAFATEAAALDAHPGRLDDGRPGRVATVAAEDRYCRLAQVFEGRPPPLMAPSLRDGRRWPTPKTPPRTTWRLQVSYWKLATAESQASAPGPQARQARRSAAEPPPFEALHALTRQPLRPVKPQQPLDIGLFETRPPEAPHIIMPDE